MTDRYVKELANLHAVYEAANQLDPSPLKAAFESAAARSAVMLGSGGSFSVAAFAAYIHQWISGDIKLRPARAASGPRADSDM